MANFSFRTLFAASALSAFLFTNVGAQAPTRDEIFILGNAIQSIRQIALRDTAKVDFCTVDEFWEHASGASKLMNAASISKHQNRRECPDPSGGSMTSPSGVVVYSMTVYADSVIVRGSTKRSERTVMVESYLYRRGVVRGVEYRMDLFHQSQ